MTVFPLLSVVVAASPPAVAGAFSDEDEASDADDSEEEEEAEDSEEAEVSEEVDDDSEATDDDSEDVREDRSDDTLLTRLSVRDEISDETSEGTSVGITPPVRDERALERDPSPSGSVVVRVVWAVARLKSPFRATRRSARAVLGWCILMMDGCMDGIMCIVLDR